jgi:hypothetical protein
MPDALVGSSVSISMTSVKPLREGFNVAVGRPRPFDLRREGTRVNNVDIASRQLVGDRKFSRHPWSIVALEEESRRSGGVTCAALHAAQRHGP